MIRGEGWKGWNESGKPRAVDLLRCGVDPCRIGSKNVDKRCTEGDLDLLPETKRV